jgi:phosphohistidine swiveling domain-containing protein
VSQVTPAQLAAWRPEMDSPVWERFPEATAANAQEVYPGVGDPLSYDVNMIAIEHGSRAVADALGLTSVLGLNRWQNLGFFAAYYGRAYINISTLREMAKWVPGGSPDAIDEQLFGLERPKDAPPWRPAWRHRLVRLRTLVRAIPVIRGFPARLAANNAAVETYLQRIQATDLTSLDDAALMRELDEAFRRNLVTCEIHSAGTFLIGSTRFEALRAFLVKRGFEDVDALVADLCTGLTDVESARPGRELARLAARIRASRSLSTLFGSGDEGTVLAALHWSSDPEVAAFRRSFEDLLRAYGYRGVRELGLDTLVWAMRPESVVGILQSYARQEDLDAEASLREQMRRREAATALVEARLGRGQRRKLRGLLKGAHAGIAARELAKSQWARSTHCLRLLVREIGRRLHARGVLAAADDVFFLRLAELKEAMAGRPPADLPARIARRRDDYRRCLDVETDERFIGRPVPRVRATNAEGAADSADGLLRGIPVSPGRVTAPARVVRELTDEVELQPGEVLVCPFTDAAWTPLFFNAAAVVMDLGGPLSHGATVAREYGLPAVVNVKTGTRRIRDGQRITVDGAAGEVVLHEA